jgi:hypothetical protein
MSSRSSERSPVRRARTRAGIERVLYRAAGDPAFRAALLADRRRAVAGLGMDPDELAVLDTVPVATLAASIDALQPAREERRSFMKAVAALSATTVGVIELAGCHEETSTGVRPDDAGETSVRAVLEPEESTDATAIPDPPR